MKTHDTFPHLIFAPKKIIQYFISHAGKVGFKRNKPVFLIRCVVSPFRFYQGFTSLFFTVFHQTLWFWAETGKEYSVLAQCDALLVQGDEDEGKDGEPISTASASRTCTFAGAIPGGGADLSKDRATLDSRVQAASGQII